MSDVQPVESRLWRLARLGAWAALGLPFIVNLDAQWLKLDDISMTEMLRGPSPARLVREIVLTQTTPHVRFAFLYHLVLAPFFRGWFASRAVVNAFFLGVVGALLCAGSMLLAPLRGRPLAWLGGFGLFAMAMLSGRTWSTLEFKTATYLLAALCVAVVLLTITRRLSDEKRPPAGGVAAAWAVTAIACFHTAELTLVAVLLLGASLVVRARLRGWLLAAIAVWPFLFWALNMTIAPRPLGLGGASGSGFRATAVLLGTLRMTWAHLAPEACVGLATAAAAIAILAFGRPFRPALADALVILAFPAAAAALALLTELRSPGYSDDRYLAFQQLCVAGGAAIALAALARRSGGWSAGLAVAACALAAWQLSTRIPALFRRAEARRDELSSSFQVQHRLRAFLEARPAAHRAREVIVFLRDWRTQLTTGEPIDATFLGATWSRLSFGRAYVCPEGRACPPITFLPNTTWLRTSLARSERANLCQRLETADVLVVEDRRVGPVPATPPPQIGECVEWLASSGLVRPAETPPRSP